jgi:hypothetical protein
MRRYKFNALDQFVAGDVIMRTGQYINTVLVLSGSIKFIAKTKMARVLCTI